MLKKPLFSLSLGWKICLLVTEWKGEYLCGMCPHMKMYFPSSHKISVIFFSFQIGTTCWASLLSEVCLLSVNVPIPAIKCLSYSFTCLFQLWIGPSLSHFWIMLEVELPFSYRWVVIQFSKTWMSVPQES